MSYHNWRTGWIVCALMVSFSANLAQAQAQAQAQEESVRPGINNSPELSGNEKESR
jgi:hypothetical protein